MARPRNREVVVRKNRLHQQRAKGSERHEERILPLGDKAIKTIVTPVDTGII